jgi:hypothetical protein
LLSSILLDDSKKPHNSVESVKTLKSFKTNYFKLQYIHNLSTWIPYEKNVQPILEEAVKNDVELQDELCKLAEIWAN